MTDKKQQSSNGSMESLMQKARAGLHRRSLELQDVVAIPKDLTSSSYLQRAVQFIGVYIKKLEAQRDITQIEESKLLLDLITDFTGEQDAVQRANEMLEKQITDRWQRFIENSGRTASLLPPFEDALYAIRTDADRLLESLTRQLDAAAENNVDKTYFREIQSNVRQKLYGLASRYIASNQRDMKGYDYQKVVAMFAEDMDPIMCT